MKDEAKLQTKASPIKQRPGVSRRYALKTLFASSMLAGMGNGLTPRVTWAAAGTTAAGGPSSLTFTEIGKAKTKDLQLAPGYSAQVVIRWGDAVRPDAPAFDPHNQSAEAQEKQFGYNNDFIAFLPLPAGLTNSDRGLLCVNHEFASKHLMLRRSKPAMPKKDKVNIEMAALGLSVVEVERAEGRWRVIGDSAFNRRISARSTRMRLTGPAAGHDRLKTSQDPTGTIVVGTLANCGGGVTPWGTVLSAEEGFDDHFGKEGKGEKGAEWSNHQRYGTQKKPYHSDWPRVMSRFNVYKEDREANRFGWIVEVDPFDPKSTPRKHTALGRFKHEAAPVIVNRDGRIVIYSGDDEREEYLYRYVSAGKYDPGDRANSLRLLEMGTLSVARFFDDGTIKWLPLVFGKGPLTKEKGFASQVDVAIETRRAADLVGATKLDRPEYVAANPTTGLVYALMTGHAKRKPVAVDKANPRANNPFGHIIEMRPPGGGPSGPDHAAEAFGWSIFLLAGDPTNPDHAARYPGMVSNSGWLSNPDNCAFDDKGRIWITTDGQPRRLKVSDSVYAADTVGRGRGVTKLFLNGPVGCEISGPAFTPNNRTLFLAIQHPGEGSKLKKPSTRWPDFQENMPPRPAVIAISKDDGGLIGS
ncbi:MAG: PhoX family phosphatase [Alphaproteobacteria bacterium]